MQISLSKSTVGSKKINLERGITEIHQFIYQNNYYLFHVGDMKAYKINNDLYQEIENLYKCNSIDTTDITDELKDALIKLNLFSPKTISRKKVINSKKIPITSISLNVAQECNMRCIYCYGGIGEYNEKGLMDFETAKKSVDFLIKNSLDKKDISIIFFGGEPLLNFSLIKKTVQYSLGKVKNTNKRLHYSITTNGSLFNNEINKFLNKYHFSVTVSFDGDKEIQDNNRPMANKKSSYDVIKPNLTNFLKSRKGNATARATVTNSFKDLKRIRQELKDIGFKRIEYSMVSAKYDQSYSIEKNNGKKILTDLEEQTDEILHKIKNKQNIYTSKIIDNIKKLRSRVKNDFHCGAGKGLVAISISGDLYPCHRFVGLKEFKLGNLDKLNFSSRNQFLTDIVDKQNSCKNCWARYLCGGGCYHENFVTNANINEPDTNSCKEIKKSYEMAIYAYDNMKESDFKYLKSINK